MSPENALRNGFDFACGVARTLDYLRSGQLPNDDQTLAAISVLAKRSALYLAVAIEHEEAA
jgi:hypothetical protein